MSEFEEFLKTSAAVVLKRDLKEKERVEYLELATAIGINNFKDYLYMILIFKRSEDNISAQINQFNKIMKERFDTMANLEKKIDEKLEATIRNILGKGAEEIARSMGDKIASKAEMALKEYEKYHFYKGQTVVITITAVLMSISYLLGTIGLLEGRPTLLTLPLVIPSGFCTMLGFFVYMLLWWYGRVEDRFQVRIRSLFWDRMTLVIMIIILIIIFIASYISLLTHGISV